MDSFKYQFNIREKYRNFIENNLKIEQMYKRLFYLLNKYWVIISKSTEEYETQEWSHKRIILLSIIRLNLLINCFRFAIIAFVDKPWIEFILFDYSSIFGNKFIYSVSFSLIALLISIGLIVIQYHEMTNQLYILKYIYIYLKFDGNPILDSLNSRIINLKLNLFIKFLLNFMVYPIMVFTLLIFLFVNIIIFINSDTILIIIPLIIWFIPSVIGLICVCFGPFAVVGLFYIYCRH